MSGRSPSDEVKLKQHRCEGRGINYIPWILVSEKSLYSTTYTPKNWKIGRDMQLLSTGEMKSFFHTNWFDDVHEIREQYVLDYDLTCEIADDLGYRPPSNRMSTDLLITVGGSIQEDVAISIKGSRYALKLENRKKYISEMQRQRIEEEYWDRKGIPYIVKYESDYNRIRCNNIRNCAHFYDSREIQSDSHAISYLIIHKIIHVDLNKERLNYAALLKEYEKEVQNLYDKLREIQRPYWLEHYTRPVFRIG